MKFFLYVTFAVVAFLHLVSSQECEICTKVLTDAMAKVPKEHLTKSDKISEVIRQHCSGTFDKEHKLCNFIGALPDSPTSMMNDVSKPLAYSMPPEKVCLKLKPKDAQICELKMDKPIDWATINLNKMRVKELKKILEKWGEQCKGCTEKSEYVRRIEELKPKFVKSEL
uniref:Mesencephalic astrocyte-derived neurotrophic factor homolog n=1 Tax=Parastrongyloides trichosuri TaxID=131310 RepID=A0A0N4ZF80_PARTI